MREQWERLRRDLSTTIRLPKIVRLYAEIARQRAELAPFETPSTSLGPRGIRPYLQRDVVCARPLLDEIAAEEMGSRHVAARSRRA